MAIFKSGNPAFGEKTFQQSIVLNPGEVMTERGTLNKFFLMFLLVMATASISLYPFILSGSILDQTAPTLSSVSSPAVQSLRGKSSG